MSEPYGQPPRHGEPLAASNQAPPPRYDTPPPTPPPYGPPGRYGPPPRYGAAPQYGPPPPVGMPPGQPGSDQTVVQPTYGLPPGGLTAYGFPPQAMSPAPQPQVPGTSRTSLWIAIGVVLAILLGGGAVVVRYVLPDLKERNAHVTVPDRIGSLLKSNDPDDLKEIDSLKADLRSAQPNAGELVAALYQDPARPSQAVMVVAATIAIRDPNEVLNQIMSEDNVGTTLTGVHDVDPGPLGGAARCGAGDEGDVSAIFCGWADHGSIGEVLLFDQDDPTAVGVFGQIHNAVLSRA